MIKIVQGQLAAMFAFDIGYEISIEKLESIRSTMPRQPISRKKHTPPYLQYATPPRIIDLGPAPEGLSFPGTVQVTIFSFGAVSVSYRWTVSSEHALELGDLPRISHELFKLDLEADARRRIESLIREIEPSIVRPGISDLVEDYFLFILRKLDPAMPAEALIDHFGGTLAQILRLDPQPLSRSQQVEAVSQRISYYESDVALIDWNAAVIVDPDFEDTVNVLELLNVELLEARYIDAQLDRRILTYADLASRTIEFPIPFRRPYKKTMRDLADLRLESILLSERVGNALKLVGDPYLARVHTAAMRRFHLEEWDSMIDRKIEIINGFYGLLSDRVYTVQSQTLELIIVILILIELFVAFKG